MNAKQIQTIEIKKMIEVMTWEIDNSKRNIETFSRKLTEEDPLRAFAWGDEAVSNAAKVTVFTIWRRLFTELVGPEDVKDEYSPTFKSLLRSLHGEMIRKVQFPETSSSPMSSLASMNEGKALHAIWEFAEACEKRIRKAEKANHEGDK